MQNMTLDYKLARSLKDAGFPQMGNGFWWMNNKQYTNELPKPFNSEKSAYIPILEELIEACGEDFYALQKRADEEYIAMSDVWNEEDGIDFIHLDKGKTPSEAVARLYLSLNEDV